MFSLYRHFDKNDRLLYVGISARIGDRHSVHQTDSNWFKRVVKITIERAAKTRKAACEIEQNIIYKEQPVYNHNGKEPGDARRRPTDMPHGEYIKYLEKCAGKKAQMVKFRRRGWSLQKIGDKFGITRQRVHQIIGGDSWPITHQRLSKQK